MTFAGFPTAMLKAGISLVTTEPAPITAPSPTVTPGNIVVFPPTHAYLHQRQVARAQVELLAERGVQAAIILTAHLGEGPGSPWAQVEAAARAHGLRILGPHCLGVIAPHARLNASIAAHFPQAGDLALISESSAIAAALVECRATGRARRPGNH